MNFQEAEQLFQELEKQWKSGRMTAEAYRAALKQIRVTGADGEVWAPQEHSGRWFVSREGKWQPATPPAHSTPPPAPPPPTPAAAQPRSRSQPRPVPPSSPGAGSSRSGLLHFLNGKRGTWLIIAAGLLAACLICGVAGVLGYSIYNNRVATPEQAQGIPGEAPPPAATSKPVEVVSAAPDGNPYVDSRGVTLVVPPETQESASQINLSSVELAAPWLKDVQKQVSIDTPFYSLSAVGKHDTPDLLSLSFPAASPNSRVLAVVDGEYLVELAQTPQDGKLTLQTRAGPSDSSDYTPSEGFDGNGTIYYAVITPKSASESPGSSHLAAPVKRQGDERSCVPDISIIGGAAINICRQNEAGTIQVMLPTRIKDLASSVDLMVDKIEATMNKYSSLGFTSAAPTKSSPMLIRVSMKDISPEYYALNGVLYLPKDTIEKIVAQAPTDAYHEMAHWIEARKYSMKAAYWSSEKTWWLETAAENMVMLAEPSYINANLTQYGTITEGTALAFQFEPYVWRKNFYVHALMLKVNMCDSAACPISQDSFIRAISAGTYPINGTAKSMISNNLKDYAFYLLGKSPSAANTSIPLSGAVKTGEGYGEYVQVSRDVEIDHKYNKNGASPQMVAGQRDGRETMEIVAPLQRDSVYPLVVMGGEGKNPGLPVELVIEPGASFYYTLDDGQLQYSDGGSELVLRPIHGTMGIRKVRIVAMGINGGEVFKAHVQTLNLEGAWAIHPTGAKTTGAIICSDDSIETDEPDGIAYLMGYILSMSSGTGDMKLDSTGRNLDWSEVGGRAPAEFTEAGITFKASTLLSGDAIQYQGAVDIPKPAGEGSSLPAALPVATLLALPLLWLFRKWINLSLLRVLANVLVISSVVLVSAGCFGLAMYGSSTLNAKFNKIEYVGGQDTGSLVLNESFSAPTGSPLWKLTGSGEYDTVFIIEAVTTDQDGKETTKTTTCTGKVTFPVMAYIFKDMTVTIPKSE